MIKDKHKKGERKEWVNEDARRRRKTRHNNTTKEQQQNKEQNVNQSQEQWNNKSV